MMREEHPRAWYRLSGTLKAFVAHLNFCMPDDAWEKRNIRQNFYSCTPLASESFKKEIRKGSKRSEP
jgi:hypothetical protein